MPFEKESLRLTKDEIAGAFASADSSSAYPPVLIADEAATLLRVPKGTIYDWSSRGLLSGCCRKVGKRLLFFRDRLMQKAFNDGIHE